MARMTADQLIAAAVACVDCGKEHKPRKTGSYTSWAGPDGHPYRTRLYQMTGNSHSNAVAALRVLAGRHG
jgi:hypothetical protein